MHAEKVVAVGSEAANFIRSWLVTEDSDEDNPNAATLGVAWCRGNNAVLPEKKQLVDDNAQEILNLVRIHLLWTRNNACKKQICGTISEQWI